MKDLTKIVVLLDKSGSMTASSEKTVAGFNSFLNEQKQLEGKATISLYQFAHELEESYIDENIQTAKRLINVQQFGRATEYPCFVTYDSDGYCTPLRDSIGKVINDTGLELSLLPESERPNKVIFVIITDGNDNSSRTFSNRKIKEMITHQQSVYNWTFLYLGADLNSVEEATNMGININTVASYNGTENIRSAFKGISTYASLSRTGALAVDINLSDLLFKNAENK